MKIGSNFAVLDVKDGRDELLERVHAGEKPKIVIVGRITGPWSRDDGTSREFSVTVEKVEFAPEERQA